MTETSAGISDPDLAEVRLSAAEYADIQKRIKTAEQAQSAAEKDVEYCGELIKNYKDLEKEMQFKITGVEEQLEKAVKEKNNLAELLKRQLYLNDNLKRIAKERANAKRGLTPKKERSGYIVLSSVQYKDIKLIDLPYQEARQQNVSITVENYRLVSIHEMQEEEKVADIWKRMKKQCEVSDVLVLNKNGEISCYYVDENYPQYLAGFIRINTSGALMNYQIDGKKGNWIATDTIIINGKQFYLMEHQVYRDQAQGVILDTYGKMVVEECEKFDEKTKQKIHDYIQQQVPLNPVEQLKHNGKFRLEHYQKFYQNGTYERSRESGTEANYDMVDVTMELRTIQKV